MTEPVATFTLTDLQVDPHEYSTNDSSGRTIVDYYKIQNIVLVGGNDPLVELYNAIPFTRGQQHPDNAELFARDINIKSYMRSAKEAILRIVWSQIGEYDPFTVGEVPMHRWFRRYRGHSAGVVTTSSYDAYGGIIKIKYKPGASTTIAQADITDAEVASGAAYAQYGKAETLIPSGIMEWEYVCGYSVSDQQRDFQNCVNSVEFMGKPRGTLRIRSISDTYDPIGFRRVSVVPEGGGDPEPVYVRRVIYQVEYNPYGFNPPLTLKLPWTGFEPPDIAIPRLTVPEGRVYPNPRIPGATGSEGNGWLTPSMTFECNFETDLGLKDVDSLP